MSKDTGTFVAYIDCQCDNCIQPSRTCSILERNTSKRFRVRCLNCGECTDWMTKPEAIAAWYKKYIDGLDTEDSQEKTRRAEIINDIYGAFHVLRGYLTDRTAIELCDNLGSQLERLSEATNYLEDLPFDVSVK